MRKKILSTIFVAMLIVISMTLSACQAENYTLTVVGVENGNIVLSSLNAKEGDVISVSFTPNEGYRYKSGSLKLDGTAISGTAFTMPAKNVEVSCVFEKIAYSVKTGTIINGTATLDKSSAIPGETVTITVTPNEKYRLKADSVKINSKMGDKVNETTFTFVMPGTIANVTAEFEILPEFLRSITIGETTSGSITVNKESAAAGESVTVTTTASSGFILKKGTLKFNDTLIDGMMFNMPDCDVVITCEFEKLYTISITTGIVNGEVKIDKTKAVKGESIKVTTKSSDNYQLKPGTLKANGVLIENGTFVIADTNVDITAEFETLTTFKRVDANGLDDVKGKYIIFGYFPQSIKSSNIELADEPDADGFYLGKDGEKYAKVEANPFNEKYKFSAGGTITKGNIYYFKLEPLKWRIMEEKDGAAIIICEKVIDNMAFLKKESMNDLYFNIIAGTPENISASNWEYSEMRTWLNGEFLNKYFTSIQREYIKNTSLNNSETAQKNADGVNDFAKVGDTVDKVFLPSFKDMTNVAYGFEDSISKVDEARKKSATDYTRARGIQMETNDTLSGKGFWLTRSASYEGRQSLTAIYADGIINSKYASLNSNGIVPCLTIDLNRAK